MKIDLKVILKNVSCIFDYHVRFRHHIAVCISFHNLTFAHRAILSL